MLRDGLVFKDEDGQVIFNQYHRSSDPRYCLGTGLGIWGVINLLEGYGNDNPGANAHVP